MEVRLVRADVDDAELIWKLQIDAFSELLQKYQDFETNPGNEPIEKVIQRLEQESTYYYIIYLVNTPVGAIRVKIGEDGEKRISLQQGEQKR